jgi:hypothetical protein
MAIVRIQLRRDSAANWTSANPVLAPGEVGTETDTGKLKIGDGSTAWTSLAYGGLQGPSGTDGADGADGVDGVDGADGSDSVVAATSPITYDAGTSTVGFDFTAFDVEDINNVTVTSPVAGQALTYNGSAWVNSQPAASGESISSFLLMGA